MKIQHVEQQSNRGSLWVEFEPVLDGTNPIWPVLHLPAHAVLVRELPYFLDAEDLGVAEGHLYLDGDGEYHWIAKEFLGEVEPKPLPGVGCLRLLWIEGETVYVLRSVE